MPGGNKKFVLVFVTFLLPPGIKGLIDLCEWKINYFPLNFSFSLSKFESFLIWIANQTSINFNEIM